MPIYGGDMHDKKHFWSLDEGSSIQTVQRVYAIQKIK